MASDIRTGPDGMAPVVELVSPYVIPSAAKEAARQGRIIRSLVALTEGPAVQGVEHVALHGIVGRRPPIRIACPPPGDASGRFAPAELPARVLPGVTWQPSIGGFIGWRTGPRP